MFSNVPGIVVVGDEREVTENPVFTSPIAWIEGGVPTKAGAGIKAEKVRLLIPTSTCVEDGIEITKASSSLIWLIP